jgi:hypothetical protein
LIIVTSVLAGDSWQSVECNTGKKPEEVGQVSLKIEPPYDDANNVFAVSLDNSEVFFIHQFL